MSDTPSTLDRVMNQAAEAAANFSEVPGTSLVPQSPNVTAVGAYAPVSKPSLDSMADNAGIQVDDYLTVKESGFRLGDMKGFFQTALVELDLTEVVPIYSVRANLNGSTTFIKSYDGQMTNQGQNFQQATAQLKSIPGQKVDGPYETAEIPVTLLEDVTDGKVTVEAGTTVGITPAITGVKFWTKFYKSLRAQNLQNATVKVRITCIPQHNTKGNDWGVVGFELVND